MGKFFLVTTILFAIFLAFIPKNTFAHFSAEDKNVSVLLHIDPDDDPIPEEPTQIHFDIEDATNQFAPKNCDCTVVVSESGKTLFSGSIQALPSDAASIYNGSISFTFPKRDVYQVKIDGKPINGATFEPFTVSWDVRVDKLPKENNSSLYLFMKYFLSLIGITTLIAILLWILPKIKMKKRQRYE
jgi:hypothetical protein